MRNRSSNATARRRRLLTPRRLRVGAVDPPGRQRRDDDDEAGGSVDDAAGARRTTDDDLPRPAVRRVDDDERRIADDDPVGTPATEAEGRPARRGAGRDDGRWPATPTSPPAPSTPSSRSTSRCASRSGTRCSRPQGDALAELTDQYNASQDRVVVELQNQNGYEELIDKYFQSSSGGPPARRADARVHAPADGRRQHGDHDDRVRPGRRLRHLAVPAAGDVRLPDRRRAVGHAAEHLQPGALLQQGDVRGGRPRSGRPADHPRRAARRTRSRSSTPAPRPTASPSTPASTPAAPGSSSSGSPAPACPTPTTTTAALPGRPRCCSTRRRPSSC